MALMAVLCGISWFNSRRIDQSIQPIMSSSIPGLAAIHPIDAGTEALQRLVAESILAGAEWTAGFEADFQERLENVQQGQRDFANTIHNDRGREINGKLAPAVDRFLSLMDRCLSLNRANRREDAAALYRAEGRPSMSALDGVLGEGAEFIKSETRANTDSVRSAPSHRTLHLAPVSKCFA
jgi:hypothetical protein